jgi:hypothetical protein
MNYKIETCRWELIYLHEAFANSILMFMYNPGMNDKVLTAISHIHKLNCKLVNKLLKNHSHINDRMVLKLNYLDLSAIALLGKHIDFADEILANEIKNKIYKLIQQL